MKLTDNQLLQKIWERQIYRVASGVVCKYIGKKYGMNEDSEYWYHNSFNISVSERHLVTDQLSKQQLLRRIRALVEQGTLWAYYGGSKRFLTFGIDNDIMHEAHQFARQFMLNKGIPEGFDTEKKAMRTVSGIPFDTYLDELRDILAKKYPTPFKISHRDWSYFDKLGKEASLKKLQEHENLGTLAEFMKEVAPDYVIANEVNKFILIQDAGW